MVIYYLDKHLPEKTTNPGLEKFKEAIYYSTKGGKKIRALLSLEFYLSLSGKKIEEIDKDSDIIKLLVAIEFLHTFSLVHDDLPSLDNDEYRRGVRTCWKEYGEDTAILVGDFLNNLAFEVVSEMDSADHVVDVIKLLSSHMGFDGMIGGQASDMYFEGDINRIGYNDLIALHNQKTGKFITAAVLGGVILSDKSYKVDEFIDFGKKLGLAFQIKDDLLDVEGTFEETGKSVGVRDGGKQEQKGFVYFMGVEKSRMELESLMIDCKNLATRLKSENLLYLVDFIGNRNR
ncbi:MAG: polyprenyl synthetase family protein [Candidatus Gracilibacteria bacterium]|nr:polyprenyl synthetase family protein [Candidatus Gracilibacteria bacterium]